MSKKPETIIIIDDRLWRSIARDTYSAATLLALTMTGRVLGIAALSWIGGFLWLLFILYVARNIADDSRKTLAEAQEYLDKLEEPQ